MSAKGSNYIGCFLNNINNIHVVHITCFGFYCIPSMYSSYKVSNLPNIWYMCLVNHSIPTFSRPAPIFKLKFSWVGLVRGVGLGLGIVEEGGGVVGVVGGDVYLCLLCPP